MNTFITSIVLWTILSPFLGEIISRIIISRKGSSLYKLGLKELMFRLKQHSLTKMDDYIVIENGPFMEYFDFIMGGAFYSKYLKEVFITRRYHDSLTDSQLKTVLGHELTHKKYQDRPYGYGLVGMVFIELRADFGSLAYGKAEDMYSNIKLALTKQKEQFKTDSWALSPQQIFTIRQQIYNSWFYIHLPRLIVLKIYKFIGW